VPGGTALSAGEEERRFSMRISGIGCLISIIISVVLSVVLTVILNLVI
jgi:hypothetical protein